MSKAVKQFKLNLPEDLKRWIAVQAAQNMRSQSAEIIFTIRERMKQEEQKKTAAEHQA